MVELYFKDKKSTGADHQSILTTLRDFVICDTKNYIDETMKALCFVNAFGGPAENFAVRKLQTESPFVP